MSLKNNIRWIWRASCIAGTVIMACVLCGCAVGKPLSLERDLRLAKASRKYPRGMAYRAAVAPVQIVRPASGGDKRRWLPGIDSKLLQREIARALQKTPVFTEVKEASSDDGETARRGGSELLLKVKLAGLNSSFGGTNGYFIPNIIVWGVLSPIASAFVADEFFNIKGSVSASLVDTASGDAVWSYSFALHERFDLNDWQRGPSVWDFFFLGPFLDTWTPAKVDSVILPHLVRKIQLEIASGILEELPPPRRSIAVVAGLDFTGLEGAPHLGYAEKDARDMAAKLAAGGYDSVEILTGEKASRVVIEKILKSAALRSDVRIEKFVFYFSGTGSVNSLLLKGNSIESCRLTLEELLKLVSKIPSENKTIIIDAGFGQGGGKSFQTKESPATELKEPSGMSVLFSSASDETSFESKQLQNGVFTSFLIRALGGKADLDCDGTITATEVIRSIGLTVPRYVMSNFGATQKPRLLADDAGATPLVKLGQ